MTMLGSRLHRDRDACGRGCCPYTWAPLRRITKMERLREKRAWRKDWNL